MFGCNYHITNEFSVQLVFGHLCNIWAHAVYTARHTKHGKKANSLLIIIMFSNHRLPHVKDSFWSSTKIPTSKAVQILSWYSLLSWKTLYSVVSCPKNSPEKSLLYRLKSGCCLFKGRAIGEFISPSKYRRWLIKRSGLTSACPVQASWSSYHCSSLHHSCVKRIFWAPSTSKTSLTAVSGNQIVITVQIGVYQCIITIPIHHHFWFSQLYHVWIKIFHWPLIRLIAITTIHLNS